jgi:hypothetical protein
MYFSRFLIEFSKTLRIFEIKDRNSTKLIRSQFGFFKSNLQMKKKVLTPKIQIMRSSLSIKNIIIKKRNFRKKKF